MPYYRFDLTNGTRFCSDDDEGVRLRDLEAAREYALEDIRDLVKQRSDADWTDWWVEITDRARRKLLTVPFSAAFTEVAQDSPHIRPRKSAKSRLSE